ncbi:beach-domain-containing protein [Lophium mytilinum]|uniref:Beach-domain-containing protein n=1 Tax=Lophium mytilinum TaxID=390894 RepID=A0A6A6QK67_9PEZI|nr:beach-domain-containing protein [Lophium mytilinum]
MDGQRRRHRSSTAASRHNPIYNQLLSELHALIDDLTKAGDLVEPSAPTLQTQSTALRHIRQLLIDSSEKTQARDAFRHVKGFSVLISTIRSLSGYYDPSKRSPEERAELLEVIKAALDVLSEALSEHPGNRRYFAKRAEDGGWSALEQALGSTGVVGMHRESQPDDGAQEQLFGYLFAFALGEETMTRIFRNINAVESSLTDAPQPQPQAQAESDAISRLAAETDSALKTSDPLVDPLRSQIRSVFSGNELLQNPDMLPIVLGFWVMLAGDHVSISNTSPLSISVLLAIQEIIDMSTHNKAMGHVTGILTLILHLLFEKNFVAPISSLLRGLADSLIGFGINQLEDAYYLFRQSSVSDLAAEFLLQGMRTSRGPPFIQFDLSLQGYSAIELADLGRPFPPAAAGGGYTFTAWIRVDHYDSDCHTTIFGAYDTTQTCFVMAYLEKDTRRFILQTSMPTSAKASRLASIRFKNSSVLKEGLWYHVAVVHRRPSAKTMGIGSAHASLYLNGEFTESMKCQYPATPPLIDGSTESFASLSSTTQRPAPILAFLGTPQDLAPRLGLNVTSSKMSVASFHLFSEPLSDEMIAVHHKLGPRYCGNYQDRLGSFQTYRASAELHVQNEILHPGKEEQSDIVSAIRSNAGAIVPENRVLLSFSPTSVMDDDDRNNVDESQLIQSLSREAALNLHKHTRMHGTPIIINAAVPSINDALTQQRGYGLLAGKPVVVVPQCLDDAMWRAGGCVAVGLGLVQLAQTPDAILRAVKILLEAVEGNWRNCEAMESKNGFAVLAEVLRQKLGYSLGTRAFGRKTTEINMTSEQRDTFVSQLLRVVLRFVGYDDANPAESLIINPLAYRVLIVDLDIWRKTSSLETQKQYYAQFVVFAKGSKHHHYNVKRFIRIRVVKRLMDALKGESFSREVFPHFLEAFKILVQSNLNGENSRYLALFVTYALHDNRSFSKRTLRPKASAMRLRNKVTAVSITPTSTPRSASPSQDLQMAPGLPLAELGLLVLEMIADLLCSRSSVTDIQRFAKNVTNKWLLYLLAEPDSRVVVLGTKILARLLVVNGPGYVKKFAEKGGGFAILKNRLKSWWNTPGIWTICFAILFDRDVAAINFERKFDLYNLTDIFAAQKIKASYPEIVPVIAAMLETGLRAIIKEQSSSTPSKQNEGRLGESLSPNSTFKPRGRSRTMSLSAKLEPIDTPRSQAERVADYAEVLGVVVQFLSDVHSRSLSFRDFAIQSNYVQELLFVLYPLIVTSDKVSAETELLSRGSALTFEGQDVVIQPLSKSTNQQAPIVRTTSVEAPVSPEAQRAIPLRRGSSFILISADKSSVSNGVPAINPILTSQNGSSVVQKVSNTVIEGLLEVVIGVFQDQLFQRKDFPGLGLFLKTPPGFQEHQAYFESYVLRHALSAISTDIQLDQNLLHEPRVLVNLSRYVTHLAEAVFEGWFLNGAEPLLDFTGGLLEHLQRPEVAKIKSVRLCHQAISIIRSIFLRVVLLRLSERDESDHESNTVSFMKKMIYWQTIILSADNNDASIMRLICYLLYMKLVSKDQAVRVAAAEFWRLLLVQKPEDASVIFGHAMTTDQKRLSKGFLMLTGLDNDAFLAWIDGHRSELKTFFIGSMSRTWTDYVAEQNRKTEETLKNRISRRKDRLKQWQTEEALNDTVWSRHEVQTNHWRSNVHASERLKHQRSLQDQQDNLSFIASTILKLERQLQGPCGLLEDVGEHKWRLDETEGRNRMRMRVMIDEALRQDDYQPKRKDSDMVAKNKLKVETDVPRISSRDAVGITPSEQVDPSKSTLVESGRKRSDTDSSASGLDEDFEMVDGPMEDEDGFEDKNRKVMRSLQRGDQVQHVCNVSRIVGLEACEGLLILGKDCLYLLDDFFQRSDGEIVRVWQAPQDERDAYVQMASGRQTSTRRPPPKDHEETARYWKWGEVISISKRRFLFRDAAIEIFFDDGRSYLLTAITPSTRNELYMKLLARAPHVNKPENLAHSENSWRLESLRNPEEAPQTFGSKFANVFGSSSSNPATKRWMKGEISNFHYLMLVNTLAGRTFNDLTQYPVFPWVLADYTSEELDLTDPRSFRDFSKPMGAQTAPREAEFRDRYKIFEEMADPNQPSFHYGTHYSSAMIVTQYLIRLQPFVQSYLLLQGGTFDHADRLFSDIHKTWLSVSKENMTDVRELIPEFFYLPEFLSNVNNYNFGIKQGETEPINHVKLPPWAKGDPHVFIAKHREALESPYVSKNLHHWIDLVFGFKQRGEAAVEATNVFHYLSYHGARNLDNIEDPMERLATIGIIHNFGQTPLQVFQRAHVQHEEFSQRFKRLDNSAESLTRLPATLLESNERVASLVYNTKSDRLLCSAAFRHNIPPAYDRYMEWGFTDGSVRFYSSESKKLLGLFEHLHQGQLTTSLFVDGRTLITAGADCTVAIWTIVSGAKSIDLQPVICLFGHRKPVTALASSRAFSVFISASEDGRVFLWDLNRSEFIRELDIGFNRHHLGVQCARINNITGHIMLCCGPRLLLFTLNGRMLLRQNICDTEDLEDVITSCAFYEGVGNEWLEKTLVFTGHRKGVVNIWQLAIGASGKWTVDLIKRLNHVDSTREDGGNCSAAITCILPLAQVVYTGDDDGRVYEWDCVQRHGGGPG